jgi:hypothetical protein
MARKLSGIPSAGSPPVTDDFSLVKGIGPVLSRRLLEAGICTYSQLASLSPAQLSEKVGGISARQIAKQDWTGQAHKLAPKRTRSMSPHKEAPKQALHQHYENFTIEFLLDEKKAMRRTRVVHIQSGDADTWAGWEGDQLLDFLARHTGTRLPGKKLEKKASLPAPIPPPSNISPEPAPTKVNIVEPRTQIPNLQEALHTGPEFVPPVLQAPKNTGFAGTLHLQDFCILPFGSSSPARSIREDQSCQARITLDLNSVVAPSDAPLQYDVTITFKQLGGVSYLVGEENNPIERSGCVTLNFFFTSPPPGLYRPEIFAKLFSDETLPGLMASLKGELIQVF